MPLAATSELGAQSLDLGRPHVRAKDSPNRVEPNHWDVDVSKWKQDVLVVSSFQAPCRPHGPTLNEHEICPILTD